MAEELTQEQKDALAADEAKKRKEQEDITIPKARFDEVNNAKKELEQKLQVFEAEKKKVEEEKLAADGKLAELLKIRETENAQLRLDVLKRDLVQQVISDGKLNAKLASMVTGSNEEEIKKSIESAIAFQADFVKGLKDGQSASDNTPGSGSQTEFKEMTAKEWMELEAKDPKAADLYLKELNERRAGKV